MPTLTRWMLKTSLVNLILALLIGLLQAVAPSLPPGEITSYLQRVEPVRVHLFVVGWITLLIFGVVYWMFPKFNREQPRGYEWLGWATYWLLNMGLLLRALAEPYARPGTITGWAVVISAVLQWLAAAAFTANTWARIKEK